MSRRPRGSRACDDATAQCDNDSDISVHPAPRPRDVCRVRRDRRLWCGATSLETTVGHSRSKVRRFRLDFRRLFIRISITDVYLLRVRKFLSYRTVWAY